MSTSNTTPTVSQRIQNYLFAEEIPYGFALMRILMPLVLLEGVLARWRFSEELFSTNGVPISLLENFGSYNYLQPLPPFLTACLMSILVLTLVMSLVGWFTRFSLVTSLILHTYFACNDTATSMTKFTVIQTHILLLLSLSGCGKIWSVDSWIAGRRNPDRAPLSERPAWATAPVWPQFLLLSMIGASYLGAALTKLHMPDFITGDAISYWIMSNPNFRHSIGEWMTQYPGFLVISGHGTVLWEILFLFLAWKGLPRMVMFAMGLFFHFMAALTLGEVTFLMVISVCYTGCLREAEAIYLGSLLRKIGGTVFGWLPVPQLLPRVSRLLLIDRLASPSPRFQIALLTMLLVTVGVGGAWVNHRLDLYGVRRPEGPYELKPMDEREVARLFAGTRPIRETDKYLGVRLGSLKVGGRLSNRCDHFGFDDVLICEASLNPPHEDMWMEFRLLDSDQKIVHRDGVIVSRESRWAQFTYKLTEVLEPGEYNLVVRSRNQEICRRPFTLGTANGKAVAANIE
jgi:hypothetical protein